MFPWFWMTSLRSAVAETKTLHWPFKTRYHFKGFPFVGPQHYKVWRPRKHSSFRYVKRQVMFIRFQVNSLAHRLGSEMVPTDLTSLTPRWNGAFRRLIASLMNSSSCCRTLTDRHNKAVSEDRWTGSCCMGDHECHLNYVTVVRVATHPADTPSLTSNAATQVLPGRRFPPVSSSLCSSECFCVVADDGWW